MQVPRKSIWSNYVSVHGITWYYRWALVDNAVSRAIDSPVFNLTIGFNKYIITYVSFHYLPLAVTAISSWS